jgi:thiol-disulfide isomerase/thioredoxin
MKSQLIFSIFLFIYFNNYATTLRIQTKNESSFYFKISGYSCNGLKMEIDKKYVHKSDTIIHLNNYQNIILTLWSKAQNINVNYLLFLNKEKNDFIYDFSLDSNFAITDLFKNGMFNEKNPFYEIYLNLTLKVVKNDTLTNNDLLKLKNHIEKYPNNLMAIFIGKQLNWKSHSSWFLNEEKKYSNCLGYNDLLKPMNLNLKNQKNLDFLNLEFFLNDIENNVNLSNRNLSFTDSGYIYFWASWCKPCIKEIKDLSLSKKNDPNYYFISIDSDSISFNKTISILNLNKTNTYLINSLILTSYSINSIPFHFYYNFREKKLLKF